MAKTTKKLTKKQMHTLHGMYIEPVVPRTLTRMEDHWMFKLHPELLKKK